ncbi:PEP-CTERM sorting domain-containing protein [Colwellia sp. BRX8-4]|uniref:PEP-CTERM sorting domain-containing protein n=1 Tax=Colwellia sp. BRX8-4 TaxID=2759836 RepID=UPI0015F47A24|nr:PEP-CTERM sorting domain-containing protein [Colwellia sp. BRX8-4]MBA6372821.1 PEP-CTERM sorting domain-containing protein [Colwellia sp. BRX8-4]
MKNKFLKVAVAGLIMLASSANAGIIASTDFDNRTVAGDTASNLDWILDGLSSPGDLSADYNLFDTTDSQNKFAVDRNLSNEGDWIVDISLNLLYQNNISLSSLTLDAYIFNNSGNFQNVQRNLDIAVSLFDSSNIFLKEFTLLDDIFANNGAFTNVNGHNVSVDLEGYFLLANNDYILRLTGSGEGNGNNAGFDNLVINGDLTSVPEPTSLAIFALGVMGLAARRFKKQS